MSCFSTFRTLTNKKAYQWQSERSGFVILAFPSSVFQKWFNVIFSENMLVWTCMVTKKHFEDAFLEFVKNIRLIVCPIGARISLKSQFYKLIL